MPNLKWLIEHTERPSYVMWDPKIETWYWTGDSKKALRFGSEAGANTQIAIYEKKNQKLMRATEHQFDD